MSQLPETRAIVIGGGVVGCAVLRELTQHGIDALLVEADLDVGNGTSKANSAIVHNGFDTRPGTMEAMLLRRANDLWPGVIDDLAVPFLAVGALMLARTADERDRLIHHVAATATTFGVETELLDRDALRTAAPYLDDGIHAALSIPGEGVIDPFWLTRAYAEAAVAGGAQLLLGRAVVGLDVSEERVVAHLDDGTSLAAEQVFNCAGLASDEIARLAGDDSFAITPRKGQFLVSEETFGVDRILMPLPSPLGKGVLITPIVFGGVLLGPTAEDQEEKSDRSTTPEARAQILAACQAMAPAVAEMAPIRQFAGVRAVSSTGDFILRPATGGDRLFHVTGIRSTGISASPAIAEFVVDWAMQRRGWRLATKHIAPAPAPDGFVEEAGEVVCLCRSVSQGEIHAACHRPVVSSTLDGLKRRCGVAFGDCQGNLCAARTAEVAAEAWGRPVETLAKHRAGSWLFVRPHGEAPPAISQVTTARPARLDQTRDVAIIGGGLAGIGTALSQVRSGRRPLLVERETALGGALRACLATVGTPEEREAHAALETAIAEERADLWCGATAVGLLQEDNGWRVLVQDARGMVEVVAERVVIATGGYVQPREHLPIAGPRGSGVVTADFVHAALDRGLWPGRSAVVVGRGRYARATASRLRAAGVEVRADVGWQDGALPVEEVRGDRRLEAVLADGRWLATDTLVLAHQLLPMAFLLRGLGLIDGRPAQPAPVGTDGATLLPGLLAVGSCVHPDVDHRASLADGLALGERLAALEVTRS